MKPRSRIVGLVALAVVAAALLILSHGGARDPATSISDVRPRADHEGADVPEVDVAAAPRPDHGEDLRRRAGESPPDPLWGVESDPPVSTDREVPDRILYLHDIDDIKHEIYAREIESVDRLYLLDDLIQTGDMDTRVLWNRDWSGVDDWKEESNGFSLQKTDDGTLIFHPDQATMDLYTFFENLEPYEYDPVAREFVSEIDYYGKPIRNVLKFINEDTLVMMTISGDKVDLNIYGDRPSDD